MGYHSLDIPPPRRCAAVCCCGWLCPRVATTGDDGRWRWRRWWHEWPGGRERGKLVAKGRYRDEGTKGNRVKGSKGKGLERRKQKGKDNEGRRVERRNGKIGRGRKKGER